jgi:hypothetical protein
MNDEREHREDAEHLRGQVAFLKSENERLARELQVRTDSAVDARVNLILDALRMAPGLDWQGLANDELRRAALRRAGHRADGSEQEVAGAFAFVTRRG